MTKRKKTAEEKDATPAKYLTPEWKALVAVVVAYARERDRWQGGVCELTLGLLRKELDRAAVAWAAAQGGEWMRAREAAKETEVSE